MEYRQQMHTQNHQNVDHLANFMTIDRQYFHYFAFMLEQFLQRPALEHVALLFQFRAN